MNFVVFSLQLLKKLRHLEEELSSDEPYENTEARPETVMRQRQERENIKSKIRAVEREGNAVLEELKRVGSECACFFVNNCCPRVAVVSFGKSVEKCLNIEGRGCFPLP